MIHKNCFYEPALNWLPVEHFAACGPDSAAVPGRVRGVVLRGWAQHLRRRAGEAALARVRARVPEAPLEVPPADWLPITLQLRLTQAIGEEVFAGDGLRLVQAVVDDAVLSVPPLGQRSLRWLGPKLAYGRLPGLWPQIQDVGQIAVTVAADRAEVTYTGAAALAHPTWRLLQCAGHLGALRLTAGDGRVLAAEVPDGFAVLVQW